MTIYLRTKENKTVVDMEVSETMFGTDISVAVIISEYSKILLESCKRTYDWLPESVIEDFTEIDEIRGWFWEIYMENLDGTPSFKDATDAIIEKLRPIAEKYELSIITD